jgi:hypothetical protein
LSAQRGAAPGRVEALGVDAPSDDVQALEALLAQLPAQIGRGRERGVTEVVELAQVGQQGRAQPAHAVVLAVGVEVGAELADDGQLQLARRLQRAPAQRALGGQVNDVGPLEAPAPHQRALGGQSHLQLRVARDGQAAQQHLGESRMHRRDIVAVLARANQLQLVSALTQALDHARNAARHAVDLRRVGFRDHRDAQVAVGGRFDLQVLAFGVHGRAWWRRCATDR